MVRRYGRRVGHFHQDVEISWEKSLRVRMFVDTGATYSIIPVELARSIGLSPGRHTMPMELADGRRVRMKAATAIVRIGDREAPATILVGRVPEPILGVETLEVLGLAVDPRRAKLIPTRGYAVRLGTPVLSTRR